MLLSSKFLSGLALPTLRSDLMRWDLCGGRRSRGRAARPTLRQLIATLFCSSPQVGRENEEGFQSHLHVTRTVYSPHHGRYIPIWTIFICQVAISGVNLLDLRRARLYPFKSRSRASRLGSRSCAHIGFLLFESFSSSVGKSSAAFSLLDAAPCVVIWRAKGERRSAQRLSRRSE
jgi:hypothetical protein